MRAYEQQMCGRIANRWEALSETLESGQQVKVRMPSSEERIRDGQGYRDVAWLPVIVR